MLVSVPSTKREVFVKVAVDVRPPLALTNSTVKIPPSNFELFTADIKPKTTCSFVLFSLHTSAVVFVVQVNTAGSSRQMESADGSSITERETAFSHESVLSGSDNTTASPCSYLLPRFQCSGEKRTRLGLGKETSSLLRSYPLQIIIFIHKSYN